MFDSSKQSGFTFATCQSAETFIYLLICVEPLPSPNSVLEKAATNISATFQSKIQRHCTLFDAIQMSSSCLGLPNS